MASALEQFVNTVRNLSSQGICIYKRNNHKIIEVMS